jgi:hypothetical protein
MPGTDWYKKVLTCSHTVSGSNPSGPPEPDRHRGPFDDHRDGPLAVRVDEHFIERRWVFLDILVLDSEVSICVILTGRVGIGSRIFAENNDFLGHGVTPYWREADTVADGSGRAVQERPMTEHTPPLHGGARAN